MSKKVYLFATCLGQGLMGKTVINTVNLLKREGIEVIYKKDQTCCGQPSYNTGYFDETKKIALHNVKLFNEDIPVLVPSGSCAGVMKYDYLELFKGEKEEEMIKNFSKRVYSLATYLDEILNVKYEDKGGPLRIAWHTNCHALRVTHSIEHGKNLIKRLKNIELVELDHEEECCGFGGTFAVKEPEVSNAMALEKVKDIESKNVKYIVTGDGGCILNIGGTLSRAGSKVKPLHLYDLLWNRIEGIEL